MSELIRQIIAVDEIKMRKIAGIFYKISNILINLNCKVSLNEND